MHWSDMQLFYTDADWCGLAPGSVSVCSSLLPSCQGGSQKKKTENTKTHEGQRSAECKVRKEPNREDKVHREIRQVDPSRLLKVLCVRQEGELAQAGRGYGCVRETKGCGWILMSVGEDGWGVREQIWGTPASWILVGNGRSKLALRRRAYGGQVGTLAATGACTCRQGEALPRGREGVWRGRQSVFVAVKQIFLLKTVSDLFFFY